MTTDVRQQVFFLTGRIADARNQLTKIDKDIELLNQNNDARHIGVGIGGDHVSFGPLWNNYKEVLLVPLLELKYVERATWEEELDGAIEELSQLFQTETNGHTSVERVDKSLPQELWYPNLPGWTWQEVSPDNIPKNIDPDEDTTVLIQVDRENKRHMFSIHPFSYWNFSAGYIVAIATRAK